LENGGENSKTPLAALEIYVGPLWIRMNCELFMVLVLGTSMEHASDASIRLQKKQRLCALRQNDFFSRLQKSRHKAAILSLQVSSTSNFTQPFYKRLHGIGQNSQSQRHYLLATIP
jgi:hypothetical protein